MMSIAEAKRIVGAWRYNRPVSSAKPLEFGNEQQIEAVRTLQELQRRLGTGDYECQTCEGEGTIECDECGSHEKECPDCCGFGVSMEDDEPKATDGRQLDLFGGANIHVVK